MKCHVTVFITLFKTFYQKEYQPLSAKMKLLPSIILSAFLYLTAFAITLC